MELDYTLLLDEIIANQIIINGLANKFYALFLFVAVFYIMFTITKIFGLFSKRRI